MNDHFIETKDLVNTGRVADSFARHFSQHLWELKNRKENGKITNNDVRNMVRVEVYGKVRPFLV